MIGSKRRRRDQAERRLEGEKAIREAAPEALVLHIVDNGPEHGWKWLCWTYDPDASRLLAGGVEGIVVPHGLKGGYADCNEALNAGLEAVKAGGWTGDLVLRGWVDAC